MGRWDSRVGTMMLLLFAGLALCAARAASGAEPGRLNIVFVLIDDLRYDTLGCLGDKVVQTPNIDRLASDGVTFRNAFVTMSLCSPSRASFLTGLYPHRHGVLNNSTRLAPDLPTFPQELKKAGYRTAFIGKWHMGAETDKPQPGFDHWASFVGQGSYTRNNFNIDGRHEVIEGYVTDVITDKAVDWLKANRDGPFMLYVSHKAIHAMFVPTPRHGDRYTDLQWAQPASGLETPENYFRRPRWVHEQRNSWHGVGDMYYGRLTPAEYVRGYYRTLQCVDDSIGRLTGTLSELGLLDSTLIIFTSDNGFLFGEHGLIDKRCMYEESIRIPMIMSCPNRFKGGRTLEPMVLNIDVAPTFLEAAGLPVPPQMQGQSLLSLPDRPNQPWRKSFLYEYFWEPAYPETPSMTGVRTDRYKYVEYQGIWDANELYDLQADPHEMQNHLSTSRRKVVTVDPEYREVYQQMRRELRTLRSSLGALDLPSWKK